MMVHAPCGTINPCLKCMINGACKYNYPRPYCDSTIIVDYAYPNYRHCPPEHGGVYSTKRVN
eukprot:4573111-Ditylum_brightwellii.AAC.1